MCGPPFFHLADHGETLGDLPDDVLSRLLPVAKKVALATGVPQYNIVQVCGTALASVRSILSHSD